MKKILIIIAILGLAVTGYAQESDTIPAPKTKTVFAQIMGINKNVLGIGNKISVEIDFGDENNFWGRDGRNEVVDENGKEMKFNTMVDAMNFMGERGWVYTDSYVITVGQQHVIHWLLQKEIGIDEDARGNIKQRRDKIKKKKEKKQPERDRYDHDDIYY